MQCLFVSYLVFVLFVVNSAFFVCYLLFYLLCRQADGYSSLVLAARGVVQCECLFGTFVWLPSILFCLFDSILI